MSQIPPDDKQEDNQQLSQLIAMNFLKGVAIPYIPVIIGLGIMFFLKDYNSRAAISLGFFIAGFRGILRMIIYRQKSLSAVYSQSRFVGDILFTIVCWGGALYAFLY